MARTPQPTLLLDEIRALQIPEDLDADEALGLLRVLLTVRNTVDHLAAVVTGDLDRLGVPAAHGRTRRELLITVGCASAVAARLARTATALPSLPTLAAHAADGAIPGEHVDAICRGITHWAHGGTTSLNNGALLCPACHTDVHHHGWYITLGIDKHPWLIPPATIDPHRRPIPAHNRRTMHLDTAA